jgi:hypothetical protein
MKKKEFSDIIAANISSNAFLALAALRTREKIISIKSIKPMNALEWLSQGACYLCSSPRKKESGAQCGMAEQKRR